MYIHTHTHTKILHYLYAGTFEARLLWHHVTLVPVLACMSVLAYLCSIFRRYSRVTTEHGIPIVLKDRFAEEVM